MVARCVVDSFVNIPIGSLVGLFRFRYTVYSLPYKCNGKQRNKWEKVVVVLKKIDDTRTSKIEKSYIGGLCICDFVPFSYDSSFENVVAQKLSLHID